LFYLLLKFIGLAQLISIGLSFLPCATFFNFLGIGLSAELLKRKYFQVYQKRISQSQQNIYLILSSIISALINATISTTLFIIHFSGSLPDEWLKIDFYHDIFLKSPLQIFFFNFAVALLFAYLGGFLTFRLGYGQNPILDDYFFLKHLTDRELNEIVEEEN